MEKLLIDEHYQYLLDCFPGDTIFNRFNVRLAKTVEILEGMGILDSVRIDTYLFKMSILDYFADIARLKDFQGITRVNLQKIYAYGTYWFLRRSPIQLVEDVDEEYRYINEKVAVGLLFPPLLAEASERAGKDFESISFSDKDFSELLDLLYYNFKYRIYSAKSLEVAIESFFFGCSCQWN